MALIEFADLPTATTEVLRRRARAAGVSLQRHIRRELVAQAGRRVPMDPVVKFLDDEWSGHWHPEVDTDVMALVHAYDLPVEAGRVIARRAAAAGMPLGDYVRQELITLARRRTVDDAVREFREVMERDPSLIIDMDTVRAAVRYAHGE